MYPYKSYAPQTRVLVIKPPDYDVYYCFLPLNNIYMFNET